MSYTDLINDSIGKVYQKGIATKILQHMDRIRNVSDISLARRWVMELFQNSRDVAYDDQPVKIKIELKDETVSFSHNGRPFRVKDILSIINQVSSKNPDENTVGQFGTGFMTTYQLSEEVEIKSILKDGDLPYKPFSIHINRRGSSQETILDEIGKSMEELKLADGCPEVEFVKEAYNTEFLYHLDSRESYQTAKTGMDDLKSTILYVLLFSERIAQVELIYNTKEEQKQIVYKRQGIQEFTKDLRVLHISCEQLGTQEQHSLVYYEIDGLTLAAEWKEECGFVPISDSTPKLFVDFPLIGAENFPFPIVINHRGFHTNEPRSGITLVDNTASNDAIVNKKIMIQAVMAYKTYLNQVVEKDCCGIEHIVTMPEWERNKEHSEIWVKDNLYTQLYQIIANESFIETEQGKMSLNNSELYIISGKTEEEKEELKQLVNVLKHHTVAVGTVNWYSVFSPFLDYGFSVNKTIFLKTILTKASEYLSRKLDEEKMEAMAWCQKLYAISMKNTDLAIKIKAGSINIFPNQNEDSWNRRELYNILQIKKDPGIPEIFKNVCEELDKTVLGDKALRIRNELLHKQFDGLEIPELQEYEISRIKSYITYHSNRHTIIAGYRQYKSFFDKARHNAWYLMLSCSPDEKLYKLCKIVYKENLLERVIIDTNTYSVDWWENTYIAILYELLEKIEWKENLENLQEFLQMKTREEVYEWLNGIISYSMKYIYSNGVMYKSIFPNQKGVFTKATDLKVDNVQEELKEIINAFSDKEDCDIYQILLDKNIIAGNFNLSKCTDETVAGILDRTIQGILASQSLFSVDLKYQEACTKLLNWIRKNTEIAQKYFPSFCTEQDQMKLLTPSAASELQEKADVLVDVMEELDCNNIEEFKKCIRNFMKLNKTNYTVNNKESETCISSSSTGCYYDGKVYLGNDIQGSYEELESIARKIGELGEKYALQKVKEYFLSQGYQISTEMTFGISLEKQEETGVQKVIIEYFETFYYHQSGYDIKVTLQSADGLTNTYYIEIKTHTRTSVYRNVLSVSDEQMKLAMRELDNYAILVVTYDWHNRRGAGIASYQNIPKQIGLGKIRKCGGIYTLYI